MGNEQVTPLSPKEAFSAQGRRKLADRLNATANLSAVGKHEVRAGPGGKTVIPAKNRVRYGIVVKVHIVDSATKPGTYKGNIVRGTTIVDPSSSTNLAEPEGMTDVQWNDCWVVNPDENGLPGHALGSGDNGIYVMGVVTGPSADGLTTVEMCSFTTPNVTFVVNLSKDGGLLGNQTTASTATYTAYYRKADTSNGAQLGATLTPLKPRGKGLVTAATAGTAYFDTAGNFKLAEAWEAPGGVACA